MFRDLHHPSSITLLEDDGRSWLLLFKWLVNREYYWEIMLQGGNKQSVMLVSFEDANEREADICQKKRDVLKSIRGESSGIQVNRWNGLILSLWKEKFLRMFGQKVGCYLISSCPSHFQGYASSSKWRFLDQILGKCYFGQCISMCLQITSNICTATSK